MNATAAATALVPALGYERAEEAERLAREQGKTLRDVVVELGWMSGEEFDEATSPEAICRLGSPARKHAAQRTGGPSRCGEGDVVMSTTPKGLRLHIGFFGRRNVGKSSLLNAITRQHVSIVSDVAGTTTDPVEKPMELLPLGPVLFIDTAGIDEVGGAGASEKLGSCGWRRLGRRYSGRRSLYW